jgi:hypothetical protein
MTRFADLVRYQPGLDAGAAQEAARRRLPQTLGQTYPMRHWRPGDPVPADGERLLIGTVVWNTPEMRLLDVIVDRLVEPDSPGVLVDVFDADSCSSADEIRQAIPGVEVMHQSPFVGRWVDGRLTEVAAGYLGRRLIARVLGLDADQVDHLIYRRPTPA